MQRLACMKHDVSVVASVSSCYCVSSAFCLFVVTEDVHTSTVRLRFDEFRVSSKHNRWRSRALTSDQSRHRGQTGAATWWCHPAEEYYHKEKYRYMYICYCSESFYAIVNRDRSSCSSLILIKIFLRKISIIVFTLVILIPFSPYSWYICGPHNELESHVSDLWLTNQVISILHNA